MLGIRSSSALIISDVSGPRLLMLLRPACRRDAAVRAQSDMGGSYGALRESRPELTERMIFITGDTASKTARRFLLAEARRPVVGKSFIPADVRGVVRGHCNRTRADPASCADS
jgi:hypothetical protein